MPDESTEMIRRSYGQNWADLDGRGESIGQIEAVVSDDFEFRLSPEIGGQVLKGLGRMMEFAEALEEDFSEIRYVADDLVEGGDRVVVLGHIVGQGRYSRFPFKAQFGHIWTITDGRATRMEAFLDQARALEVAGVRPA